VTTAGSCRSSNRLTVNTRLLVRRQNKHGFQTCCGGLCINYNLSTNGSDHLINGQIMNQNNQFSRKRNRAKNVYNKKAQLTPGKRATAVCVMCMKTWFCHLNVVWRP